jgi:hypothetical protein
MLKIIKQDRRTKQGCRLRVYLDAIKQAKAMTQDEWVQNWISSGNRWMPKDQWISYLETCALKEAEGLTEQVAA